MCNSLMIIFICCLKTKHFFKKKTNIFLDEKIRKIVVFVMNEINVYIFHKSEIVDFRIFDNSKKIVKNETIIEIVNKDEFICIMFKIETQFDDCLTTERISTQIEQNDENNRTTIADDRRRPEKSGFADAFRSNMRVSDISNNSTTEIYEIEKIFEIYVRTTTVKK